MKRNTKRPGFLAGYQGLVPKAASYFPSRRKSFNGLGSFGKGVFIPIPNAPAGAVPIPDAVDASTGQPYMQDPRCPEGEKMVQVTIPCEDPTGTDPCDPGEFEIEDDCQDDPVYKQKPPSAPVMIAPVPAASNSVANKQAEIQNIAEEEEEVDAMVTAAPEPASTISAGTGSTYLPPLASPIKAPPSDQQKLLEMVAQYQVQTPAPKIIRRVSSTPTIVSPKADGVVADAFSWLRNLIFGSSSSLDGWSDNKLVRYGIPSVVLVAIVCYLCKRKS